MLEIITLIFLSRKTGEIAKRKGENPGNWKLYTILAWIGGEILGVVLAMLAGGGNFGITVLLAYGMAAGAYFFVRSMLTRKPDVQDDWLDTIGNAEAQQQQQIQ